MGFPGEHLRFHPYVGMASRWRKLVPPQRGVRSHLDQFNDADAVIQDERVGVSPLFLLGGQCRLRRFSVFGRQARVRRRRISCSTTAGRSTSVTSRSSLQRGLGDRSVAETVALSSRADARRPGLIAGLFFWGSPRRAREDCRRLRHDTDCRARIASGAIGPLRDADARRDRRRRRRGSHRRRGSAAGRDGADSSSSCRASIPSARHSLPGPLVRSTSRCAFGRRPTHEIDPLTGSTARTRTALGSSSARVTALKHQYMP